MAKIWLETVVKRQFVSALFFSSPSIKIRTSGDPTSGGPPVVTTTHESARILISHSNAKPEITKV